MAAAIEAHKRGCRVTVLDEAPLPGGQIYRQSAAAAKPREFAEPGEIARKKRLLEEFAQARPIDYRAGVAVYAVFGNREVHVAQGERTEVLCPDAVVLATGVRENAIPFPGWTTPGVMYAGGAQAILKSQGVLPGRRIVVAGCGPLPMVVAAQMLRAGGTVEALAILSPMSRMLRRLTGLWRGREILLEGLRYLQTIRGAGVTRLPRHVVTHAIGGRRLEAVVLSRIGRDGKPVRGTERELACDLLALNYGFTANSELAAMAGAQLKFERTGGGWVPAADRFGRTSAEGIFVAGDCAGLRGALVAEAEGRIVGAAAAGAADLEHELREALWRRSNHQAFQAAVRATFDLPPALWSIVTDDTIVCRCENVKFAEIRQAFQSGHVTPNAVKRNARPGMGWCAGRTCLRAIGELSEFCTGAAQAETMTARPMARPVSFAALSNQTRAAS
jgi:NADPH-dependent 2,4-dienoyl-CoA reductase/sulfur reductase-like enzyme